MKKLFGACLLFVIIVASCKKSSDSTPAESAGTGGNATLNIFPAHHTKTINLVNMTIYIKYNTKDKPATYDDSAKCNDNGGVPFATIASLKKGDYYIYGYGYDSSIHQNVKGGTPYTITDEVSQHVDLAVSEE